jgi:hypothetical protein
MAAGDCNEPLAVVVLRCSTHTLRAYGDVADADVASLDSTAA